jgi:hypothetical protein
MREIRSSGSVGEPVGNCRLYPEGSGVRGRPEVPPPARRPARRGSAVRRFRGSAVRRFLVPGFVVPRLRGAVIARVRGSRRGRGPRSRQGVAPPDEGGWGRHRPLDHPPQGSVRDPAGSWNSKRWESAWLLCPRSAYPRFVRLLRPGLTGVRLAFELRDRTLGTRNSKL